MSGLPQLSGDLIRAGRLDSRAIGTPDAALLALPEKAVQFGTGAFLRGFVDYFIDAANRSGSFGGRVVAVGSTGSGRERAFNTQNGLYTLATRGVDAGVSVSENRIIASVSRALSATAQWPSVLACARNPDLELVFSNTTEVGIALDEDDDPAAQPPRSFPGKLLRFLYERGRVFDYDPDKGVVVIPCELIEDNGTRLRDIVLALCTRCGLGNDCARWIASSVRFCNTLVDRIVPGRPDQQTALVMQQALSYRDELLTVCEPYRLFAIEATEATRRRLTFAGSDSGIVLADDIAAFRERKVRLLNGAHTILVPAAILCGCETVGDAVEHPLLAQLLRRVLFDEIAPGLDSPGAELFADEVLERFANPFMRHALVDITLQATMKMRVRVVPSIVRYTELNGAPPPSLAFGFAAYVLYMRGGTQHARRSLQDEPGQRITQRWAALPDASDGAVAALAHEISADATLWGIDLTRLTGFADAVAAHLVAANRRGVLSALEAHLATEASGRAQR